MAKLLQILLKTAHPECFPVGTRPEGEKYRRKWAGLVLLALFFLPGCSPTKKPVFTPRLSHARSHGKRDLHVDITRATGQACIRELGGDLTRSGLVMVVIHAQNHGGDRYIFRPSYADIPRVSAPALADLLYYDTPTRCIWLSVPALLLWWPAIPLVVVPCGIMWSQSNQQLESHISKKLIGPDTVFKIAPYETVEKFFFVPEELWLEVFSIGFFDKNTGELVRFTADFSERRSR